MKKVQHGIIATRKECNRKNYNIEKSATWKQCNLTKVQQKKSVTRKKCNMKMVTRVKYGGKKVHKYSALECTNG